MRLACLKGKVWREAEWSKTTTERILLEELLNKGSVRADMIKGPVDIMGRPAIGGMLIQGSYDTIKAETVRPVQPDETYLEERREAEVL